MFVYLDKKFVFYPHVCTIETTVQGQSSVAVSSTDCLHVLGSFYLKFEAKCLFPSAIQLYLPLSGEAWRVVEVRECVCAV